MWLPPVTCMMTSAKHCLPYTCWCFVHHHLLSWWCPLFCIDFWNLPQWSMVAHGLWTGCLFSFIWPSLQMIVKMSSTACDCITGWYQQSKMWNFNAKKATLTILSYLLATFNTPAVLETSQPLFKGWAWSPSWVPWASSPSTGPHSPVCSAPLPPISSFLFSFKVLTKILQLCQTKIRLSYKCLTLWLIKLINC